MLPKNDVCLFILFLVVVLAYPGSSEVHDLNIMMIVSFGRFGFNSSGVIPAVDIALEDINKHPDVLPGYRLKYGIVRDSQCLRGQSLNAFFEGIQSNPVKLAVVGCGCSTATEPVAEISHHWNISQISYASTLAALSDRTRFKRYFRNDLPIAAPALRSTMNYFEWKRIALLTQDENHFTVAESTFRKELEPAGITVENYTFKTEDDPLEHIQELFDKEYRIFFLNSYSGPARNIICYALKRNYTFPRYVWMTYDWFPPRWWTLESSQVEVNCTNVDLTDFIERSLSFQWRPVPDDENATTDSGKSFVEFEVEYKKRAISGGYNTITHSSRMYDALWALAFALNQTMTVVDSDNISGTGCQSAFGSLVPLHEFTYKNELMGCLIQSNLQRTNFSGLTGNVVFDENGTRVYPNVRVLQYQRQGMEIVRKRFALLDISHNYTFSYIDGAEQGDIYPAGIPPDGTPIIVIHTFKVELVVILDISAGAGIIFAIVCLVFNVVFRNKKIIRLTSPNLNYFIIAGAIVMYSSIFFCLIPSTTNATVVQVRCKLHHMLFTLGYTLAFVAVLVKMWRVYHIFRNPHPNKKILSDWRLIGIVLFVTGIFMCLLLLEEAIPELRGYVQLERDLEDPTGRNHLGIREDNYEWVCYATSSPSFFWQIFIFACISVLQIIGIVLAVQTRKVKIASLRDSKFVAAIIYISSILIVALAMETFALRNYINIGSGIITAGIFTLTTLFLALIFIPKMVLLWRDPEGKSISSFNTVSCKSVAYGDNSKDMQKIATLQKTICERDTTIVRLKDQITMLRKTDAVVNSA